MNIISTLALCASLVVGSADFEHHQCHHVPQAYHSVLKTLKLSESDREAITRVSYAEAATQGEAGLAGVVYTILNRLIKKRF